MDNNNAVMLKTEEKSDKVEGKPDAYKEFCGFIWAHLAAGIGAIPAALMAVHSHITKKEEPLKTFKRVTGYWSDVGRDFGREQFPHIVTGVIGRVIAYHIDKRKLPKK